MAHVISNKSQYGKISPTAMGTWSSRIWHVISTPDSSFISEPITSGCLLWKLNCKSYRCCIHLSLKVLVAQSYPTFCDPMDYSPPGFSVHGLLQARILEWVAISSSRGVFLTQGSNLGLLHCRQILYHLNHQESPHLSLQSFYFFN